MFSLKVKDRNEKIKLNNINEAQSKEIETFLRYKNITTLIHFTDESNVQKYFKARTFVEKKFGFKGLQIYP